MTPGAKDLNRMPVQPNLLERLLFFQLNQAPAPLLDLAGALAYQALAAAAQLDLFQVLGRGPMKPAELAAQLESEDAASGHCSRPWKPPAMSKRRTAATPTVPRRKNG
jgi:hypothetical protein